MPEVLSYLDAKAVEPMTREQTEFFIRCCIADMDDKAPVRVGEATRCGEAGLVLFGRLNQAGATVPITLPAAAFILFLSDGLPGEIVMWAYAANRLYARWRRTISTDELAEAFPNGFPTESERLRLWDAQKGNMHGRKDVGNMVDLPETWTIPAAAESPR